MTDQVIVLLEPTTVINVLFLASPLCYCVGASWVRPVAQVKPPLLLAQSRTVASVPAQPWCPTPPVQGHVSLHFLHSLTYVHPAVEQCVRPGPSMGKAAVITQVILPSRPLRSVSPDQDTGPSVCSSCRHTSPVWPLLELQFWYSG